MSPFTLIAKALYDVQIDMSFIIPIAYFVPLVVCSVVRAMVSNKVLRYTVCITFLISFAGMWFVMLVDDSLWRIVVPGVVLFGGAAGLWGWFRALLKAFKNIGDPDSYLK